jgi:ATP adenylyltransferase
LPTLLRARTWGCTSPAENIEMREQSDSSLSTSPALAGPDQDQGDAPLASESDVETATVSQRRLWTPWRMTYVAGAREAGCIFCLRLAANDDARTLILYRGERIFVIMNLFPYNTGHVMIVPNQHIASPEDADAGVLAEMATVRPPLLRALRRALSAEGFNVGMNVGAVAGAGVVDHFHEHVVPRWQGDANFMPILAATMVIPELIPVTYAKLRAEVARELSGASDAVMVVLARDGSGALTRADGTLPTVSASSGEAIWQAVRRGAERLGAQKPEILGWTGDPRSGGDGTAIAVLADIATSCLSAEYMLASFEQLESTPVVPTVRAARQLIDRRGEP